MEFTFDDTMPELTLEPELETVDVVPAKPEPPKAEAFSSLFASFLKVCANLVQSCAQ